MMTFFIVIDSHDMDPGIAEHFKEGEHYCMPLDSAPYPKVIIYEPDTESSEWDSDWMENQEY